MSDAQTFKLDMKHLQKVQRTIRKTAAIFPDESELLKTLEERVNAVQDDNALNTYYSMSKYLKQNLKLLQSNLQQPMQSVEEALVDTEWSINYLRWLVTEQNED